MTKKKMSNKAYRFITIPIVAILILILVVLNAAANIAGATIDTYLGKGATYVDAAKGTEDWDTDYYSVNYSSADEATEAAYEVAARIQQEGSVLLKNDGVLPLKKGSTVMPFGYAYLSPSYGQNTSSGSGKWVIDPVIPEEGLADYTIDSSAVECMEKAGEPTTIAAAEGTVATEETESALGGDKNIYEYEASIYDGLTITSGETAIVFLSRGGQEGADMKYDAYADGTPHYLALSQNEKDTIKKAKETCDNLVVVIIASATMEIAPITSGELEADAILWMGHPGERGMAQLSALLSGDVNPSGRTVDTYAVDLTKDPTYQSIGVNTYSNVTSLKAGYVGDTFEEIDRTYNEYMEGVYMGYRYYETASEVDENFVYEDEVLYPFGYGLSYTTFEKTLDDLSYENGTVTANVTVKNTGDYSGKEVVQLYLTSPYTDIDREYLIEKPSVVLAAFDKTDLLSPGESQTITLTFDLEDMASYSYKHENSNGTVGCYMLDAGEYIVSLRNNSHDLIASESFELADTIWYDGSDEEHIRQSEIDAQSLLDDEGNPTGVCASEDGFVAASNLFQNSSDYMNEESTLLTGTDWSNTQPKATEGNTKELSDKYASLLGKEASFDVETDELLGNVEGSLVYSDTMPVSNADNGLTLSDLRGKAYDDELWDDLLDQIDWEADKDGILMCFTGAAYATGAIDSIGLPETVEPDGANGLKVGGVGDGGYDMTQSSTFGFEPLMAATWNEELLYEVGEAFGQESLQHGINGWYSPGINLHRSQFSGRIFEYYSEDPLLSGKMAANVISGAGDQGMFCYIKHFALNETETGRANLIATWADEQTMRELYFKAFEIAIKEAKSTIKYTSDEEGNTATKVIRSATAIMPAQNAVGYELGECNYSLITSLLRGEWGFTGTTVSDYWVWGADNIRDYALRSGCDTYLCNYMPSMWNLVDYDSATARNVMRNAIHHIAYTVVNSNAMQNVAPGSVVVRKTAPWRYAVAVINILFVVIIALLIYSMVRRARDEKKNPDKYKRKIKPAKIANN